MRLLASALLLAGCAAGGRGVPAGRVKSAVVAARVAQGGGLELARRTARLLSARGAKAEPLEEADSVAAGTELGPEAVLDPRFLAEIRSTTGADAVIFLSLEGGSLEVTAADARGGDLLVRETLRPRGPSWEDGEAAAAAARFLAPLWAERKRPRPTEADEPVDEIPVP